MKLAAPAIRSLREADIPVLVGVLARAYQSAARFDLRLRSYLAMERVATFVAELDGIPVGMVVGNDYGSLAYVSQMAVDPPLGRRGIGTLLMERLVSWLEDRQFSATELDATPSGIGLYRRYGFAAAGETAVFRGLAASAYVPGVRSYVAADRAALLALDAAAFGGDRSDVLRGLFSAPESAVVVVAGSAGRPTGYAVAQTVSERLGPLIAATPRGAAQLFDAARALFRGEHTVSIPADQLAMRALLAARGYAFDRSLTHMLRGRTPPGARDRLYARINLGQG